MSHPARSSNTSSHSRSGRPSTRLVALIGNYRQQYENDDAVADLFTILDGLYKKDALSDSSADWERAKLSIMKFLTLHAAFLASCQAIAVKRGGSWPNGPFRTNGPNIIDSNGTPVTYVGVNWPGAADVMIPEGLQYSSIANIVSKVKDLGMNVVRLTYAIEMVDDILDNGGDVSLQDALQAALGSVNGTTVLNQILRSNPTFTSETTRLQVYDAIAEELAKQRVYIHLDNHVSKGEWCCSHTDGNGWFGDIYFDVEKWRRGLAYMANHTTSWIALTSMSLRNELRWVNSSANATYGWPEWYDEVIPAASGIHAANEAPLIFFSGLDYDTDLAPITAGADLGDGRHFNTSSFDFADKVVFELHNYDNSETNCTAMTEKLYNGGFNAMDTSSSTTAKNIAPVVLTEFGFEQNETAYSGVYPQCIKDFVTEKKAGWMQWVLAGSYYIRSGGQDFDETWGLLNHDWSEWRSEATIHEYTAPMVKDTLP